MSIATYGAARIAASAASTSARVRSVVYCPLPAAAVTQSGSATAAGAGSSAAAAGALAASCATMSCTSPRKRLKPSCSNSGSSTCVRGGRTRQVSRSSASGTSRRSVTSWRLRSNRSAAARRFSPRLPRISSAWAIRLASVSYSASSCAAVFGPIPGTPGTLSVLSPVRVCRSITWSGRTPLLANRPAGSRTVSCCTSTITTRSVSSCSRSLSRETMRNSICSWSATCAANVAITSSASNPGAAKTGMPNASINSRTRAIWGTRSSGVGRRVALYSGKISPRKPSPSES